MSRSTPARRLALEPLEERAVPANNLTITTDPDSLNVRITHTNSTVVIDTTGPGAQLSLATLREVLLRTNLERVTVTTAADIPAHDGLEAGSISWPAGVGAPDLAGVGPARSVTFRTVPGLNAVGNIDLTGVAFDGPASARVGFGFDTSAVNGAVTFHDDGVTGVSFGPGLGGVGVNAGTGPFTYEDNGGTSGVQIGGGFTASGGLVQLTPADGIEADWAVLAGQSLTLAGRVEVHSDVLRIRGPVTLAADTQLINHGNIITLNDSVDGNHHLTVQAGALAHFNNLSLRGAVFLGPIGTNTPLAGLTIAEGFVEALYPDNHIATVQVGTGAAGPVAAFGLSGTLTGNLIVRAGGVFSAGGVDRAGVLTLLGDATFDGGTHAPDLGANPDELTVAGDVNLLGATLGGGFGSGQLAAGPVPVLNLTGILNGTFANAALGVPLLVGTDAATVTSYGPSEIVVAPLPTSPTPKRVVGVEADGTAFTATLAGPGRLVSDTDFLGRRFLVVRGARPLSALTITTRANMSDALVTFDGGVAVGGPLGSFSAPQVDVAGQFAADSAVRSIRIRDLIDTGGVGLRLPDLRTRAAVAARHISADIWSLGELTALNLTGDLTGDAFAYLLGSARMRHLAATGRLEVNQSLRSFVATGTVAGTLHPSGLGSFCVAEVAPTGRIEFGHLVGLGAVTGSLAGTVTGISALKLTVGEVEDGHIKVFDIGTLSVARDFNGDLVGSNFRLFTMRGGSARLDLSSRGVSGTLRVTGPEVELEVDAGRIEAIEVAGTLHGRGEWTVRGIDRLTAGAIDGLDLTSTYLGPVLVRGHATFGIAGELRDSTIRTTAARLFGIDSITVLGNVMDTTICASEGDVGPVRVGRFLRSQLHVDYTPAGPFNTGGSFDHPGLFYKLWSFTTTARRDPAGGPWAFEDSELAADAMGQVRLSGLKTANAGTAFGLKVHSVFESVRVAAADDETLPLLTDLAPSPTALAGDFFFVDD